MSKCRRIGQKGALGRRKIVSTEHLELRSLSPKSRKDAEGGLPPFVALPWSRTCLISFYIFLLPRYHPCMLLTSVISQIRHVFTNRPAGPGFGKQSWMYLFVDNYNTPKQLLRHLPSLGDRSTLTKLC